MSETGTRNGEDSGMSTGRHIIVALMVLGVVGCGGSSDNDTRSYASNRWTEMTADETDPSTGLGYTVEGNPRYTLSLEEAVTIYLDVMGRLGIPSTTPPLVIVSDHPEIVEVYGIIWFGPRDTIAISGEWFLPRRVLCHELGHHGLSELGFPKQSAEQDGHEHTIYDYCEDGYY